MRVCVCALHVSIYACAHFMCMACMLHACAYMCMHVRTCACMCVYVHVRTYMHIYVRVKEENLNKNDPAYTHVQRSHSIYKDDPDIREVQSVYPIPTHPCKKLTYCN